MFSNLFRKKSPPVTSKKFLPENRLETLLMQAAIDVKARSDFYKEFLSSDLFILGEISSSTVDTEYKLHEGDKVHIREMTFDGKSAIPVFSSLRRLRESITASANYVRLNGRSLIELVGVSKDVILNPGLAYGKQFLPNELKSMLDGSALHSQIQEIHIKENQQIIIGQPKEYPQELIDKLISLFGNRSNVERAYLAWYAMSQAEEPHYLIAIDLIGNVKPLFEEIGKIILDTLGPSKYIDIIPLRGGSSLENYFKSQKPFFQKE